MARTGTLVSWRSAVAAPAAAMALLCMPAWNDTAIGSKLVTVIPTASQRGGRTGEASYLLLDRATGAPRALLDGEALTPAEVKEILECRFNSFNTIGHTQFFHSGSINYYPSAFQNK